MNIKFKQIELYNFCSYAHELVSLENKGFCLVAGKNQCKKDNAISNGAGKSTIWSAISYALIGETLTGLRSNLKRLTSEENLCYVVLELEVDKDYYKITRQANPRSDLRILKNGCDISGKTFRESEAILAENLRDLNKDLLMATIILGQGMPNRFSSFSPSGRKELLEKLTKSDFMIEDVKARVDKRQKKLLDELRTYEDSLLINKTQLQALQQNKVKLEASLSGAKQDFDQLICQASTKVQQLTEFIEKYTKESVKLESYTDDLNNEILIKSNEKIKINAEEIEAFSSKYNELLLEKNTTQSKISSLELEIKKLKQIKDVCPTCGQKIPGVLIPNTSTQEQEISKLKDKVVILNSSISKTSETHKNYLSQIDEEYSELSKLQEQYKQNKNNLAGIRQDLQSKSNELLLESSKLTKLKQDKENTERYVNNLSQQIAAINLEIETNQKSTELINAAKITLDAHLSVLKKIESLIKRDFRGYLLYNIIEYLNNKAQEYSNIVFNTHDLRIYLDKNALDIAYGDKLYESLSGGERQRVDLIVQFAIRDLLQKYFNYSSNILVLDEITDNLDKLATEKIFDLITSSLKDVESVFVISHHSDELDLPCDSTLQINKDCLGNSSITWEN